MIVPFVYNLYNLYNIDFLWVFYKYVNFCSRNNMPIIAQEHFFEDPQIYFKKGYCSKNMEENFGYKTPSYEEIKSLKSYKIKDEIDKNIIPENCENISKLWADVIKNGNHILEEEIIKAVNHIEKISGKKIKCIITWLSNKSLISVCNKLDIQLINMELSSIRKGIYNINLGYFCKNSKYDNDYLNENYKKYKPNIIFTRTDLLAMILKTDYVDYIKLLNQNPIYDVGIISGLNNDIYEMSKDCHNYSCMFDTIDNYFNNEDVVIRFHPSHQKKIKNLKYSVDNSKNSLEFVSKCDIVAAVLSNVVYEAMLLGKKTKLFSENNSILKMNCDEHFIDADVVNLKYLNYVTFAVLTPFDLLFDYDYIIWRLSNPDVNDIYNKNLDYFMHKYNISDKIVNTKGIKRSVMLIKKIHGTENFIFTSKYKVYLANKNAINELNEINNNLNKKYMLQEENIKMLSSEINHILISKSWNLTKPLRWISRMLKK